ncbi:MAG: tetratricopeptide repeat protein [Polyangiaceae bacterium]|nr:tetratricopeptide repeat protein [Polyangiaceae bacterium]
MHTTRIAAAAVASLFCFFSNPTTAPAQEGVKAEAGHEQSAAEELFKKAVEHMKEGRFERACPLLEESYRLDPLPGALFMLASCEAERGRVMTAVKRFGEYLTLYESLSPEKKGRQGTREKDAREMVARLRPQVAAITLVRGDFITTGGTIIKMDGTAISPSLVGTAVSVDPGEHVITTQEGEGPVREHRVKVGPGESREVTLYTIPFLPPFSSDKLVPIVPRENVPVKQPVREPDRQMSEEPVSRISGQRIAAYALGGMGAPVAVAGAIMVGVAVSDQTTTSNECEGIDCLSESEKEYERRVTLRNVGIAGIVLGTLMVGGAVTLFVTDLGSAPSTSKGGVQARVSIGGESGGAGLQIQGRW